MIRFKRPECPGQLWAKLDAAAKALEVEVKRESPSQRVRFDPSVLREAKSVLLIALHRKCAYCESLLTGTSNGDVENFRPKWGAVNGNGTVDQHHYWWLAYEWDNLLVACQICNQANKKNHFPVIGNRIGPGENVRNELPLLIDPSVDDPAEHLLFKEDGVVEGITDRGVASIAILGLNRATLVESRAHALATLKFFWDAFRDKSLEHQLDKARGFLNDAIHPSSAYSMSALQALARWATSDPKRAELAGVSHLIANANEVKTPKRIKIEASKIARTVLVKSIEITNFRAIDKLQVEFAVPVNEFGSMLMLLGENGSGKSSVLQALAITLIGEDGLHGLLSSMPNFSYDRMIKVGKTKANVKVTLTGDPNTIELELARGKPPVFKQGGIGVPSMVLAYGATRLLPEGESRVSVRSTAKAEHRVQNLFDPFMPLISAERWLCSLDDKQFEGASLTLIDLLRIDAGSSKFERTKKQVFLHHHGRKCTLATLSSGYQCIVALGADIMQASPRGIFDKKEATGIVIIDELDAHLHPRWKMEVTSIFRKSFPEIQFVATTHEPLLLRGCRQGEVLLMELVDHKIRAARELPNPEELRVDQLLTSRFFGLQSTIDPNVDRIFTEYYHLLAKLERTQQEEARLEQLKNETKRYGVLGYTRRDQLAYECIDQFLAKEKMMPDDEREQLREDTKSEVVNIWRQVEAWKGRTL